MPANRRVTTSLLIALDELAEFSRTVGDSVDADRLSSVRRQLTADKLTPKQVEALVYDAKGRAAFGIEQALRRLPQDSPEATAHRAEFGPLLRALGAALFPQQRRDSVQIAIPIRPGAGEMLRESVEVIGSASRAQVIAERAADVVIAISNSVFDADEAAAYDNLSASTRNRLSLKAFGGQLEGADTTFGGHPVALEIEGFGAIYAEDEPGSPDDSWPPTDSGASRRATVRAFWFTEPEARRGRWVFFWVCEEAAGYRILKLHQYLQ